MTKPNPWLGKNYFNIDNKMAVPPAFWLERLYDFDAELVVFPSQQVPFAYCLARRAKKTGGINAKLLEKDMGGFQPTPDTKFCITHRLLPVTHIFRYDSSSWSIDNILAELRARDTWAHGGSAKVADLLDEQDEAHRAKVQKNIREDFYNRSGDAWRSYNLRAGSATAAGGTVAQASRRVNRSNAKQNRSDSSSTVIAGA